MTLICSYKTFMALEMPHHKSRKYPTLIPNFEGSRQKEPLLLCTYGDFSYYKAYGKDSIKKVKDNPYCLADDIWGIGFKTADSIASKMGYTNNDPRRCKSGIVYVLNQLSNEGHVYAERKQLLDAGVQLLSADRATLEEVLDKMIETEEVKTEDEAIYLPPLYYSEVGVASKQENLHHHRRKARLVVCRQPRNSNSEKQQAKRAFAR